MVAVSVEFDGRERQNGPSLKTFGLGEARAAARICRQQLAGGQNPIEVRDAQKARTERGRGQVAHVRSLCEYMAAHEAGWRNAKHRYQSTASLKTFAYRGSAR
jgi:hypothetical protein